MKISIITPVHNDPRIAHALDSVLSQEEAGTVESIVIDGGSTDATRHVLDRYTPRLATLVSEPDKGTYDAMNKGIALATGNIVGILNADDRYQDSLVLHDIVKAFEDPSVAACYGDLVYVDGDDRVVRHWRSGTHRRLKWYAGWMPPHPAFFVRREAYERYGAFDTQYRIAADYELMLRLLMKHRLRTAYLHRVLVRMATGGQSNRSVRNILRAAREVRLAWKNNGLVLGYAAPFLKPAQKVLQFRGLPLRGHPLRSR